MEYVRVAANGDVSEGGMKGIEAGGQEILLVRVDGAVYALDAICNHGYAYLEEGELDGHDVVCPLHGGCFDVRTGSATQAPCVDPLRTFPVRVDGDDILVGIE